MGRGLLHAALQGVFPDRDLFESSDPTLPGPRKSPEQIENEQAMERHSPEIILQGLAEGLPDASQLTELYNQMVGLSPNPLHTLLAQALQHATVPAIFTTNQDQCIEDAAEPGYAMVPIFDTQGFKHGLHCTLFQFHGAIGGNSAIEVARRKQSLTYTLNSMGPRLPPDKQDVLCQALARHPLIFLGYSGSDPDIWYSLYDLLTILPHPRIYWCVQGTPSTADHRTRLDARHAGAIVFFRGDLVTVLRECDNAWGLPDPGAVSPGSPTEVQDRLVRLRGWAPTLTLKERSLAYGWVLVSVGRYRAGAQLLEQLADSHPPQPVLMMAHLFAGYARRELSEHMSARAHLRQAVAMGRTLDRCRYAQAMHKLGESLSTFESVRWWHFWPTQPKLHEGAGWLLKAIKEYESLPAEERAVKSLGRAGLAHARMNLGQLYRRTAAYTPGLRPRLAAKARQGITDALKLLEGPEMDLRALAMADAAVAADDTSLPFSEKRARIDLAIDYTERWTQDQIQIGSAYFAKGRLLATISPSESDAAYQRALAAFSEAQMMGELARTELELAFVLAIKARQHIAQTQASREWQWGLRVLGVLKVLWALLGPKR